MAAHQAWGSPVYEGMLPAEDLRSTRSGSGASDPRYASTESSPMLEPCLCTGAKDASCSLPL